MPSINDLVQVAESLEKGAVAVLGDRCVAVRNRNASCRKCVNACQAGALQVSANQVKLDAGACMACGACATVCPTGALQPLQPTDVALGRASAEAAARFEGHALIACARISSKHAADPRLYAEVPCLARVDESLLVGLVANGANAVTLVDGTCATCKYGSCSLAIDETMLYANGMLAAQGSEVRARRASEFPGEALVQSAEGLFGSTRRGFFSEAAGAAKETAFAAARVTIETELGYTEPEVSIGERLRVTADGTMPQYRVQRHDALINAMDALGQSVVPELETRRFSSVNINLDICNACGMCAVFCTTGAIRRDDAGKASADLRYLEFSASECVHCGLCADVCWKGALSISDVVSTDQLFDFEPRVFVMNDANRKSKSPFGR